MKITPLAAPLGAEVTEVDIKQLADEDVDRIKDAWREHMVLVFRDQELSPDDQMDFAARFGELDAIFPDAPAEISRRERYMMDITNLELDDAKSYLPDGEMYFHFDTCYRPEPYSACFLYGIEVPGEGGQTLFGNMVKAYEELPQDLKDAVAGKTVMNAYEYAGKKDERREPSADSPHCEHPIVTRHPETGRPNLFVSRLMSFGTAGRDDTVQDEVLNRIFEHAEEPRFVYAHDWKAGDLVVWDNRCVSHARTFFDPSQRRHLRRVSVKGAKPAPALA